MRPLSRTRPIFLESLEPRQMLASDFLLEIDGIKGESKDSKHAGAIEIQSFSWGGKAGTNTAPDPTVQDFHFVANQSTASPVLFKACATGQHIPDGTLFVRKPGTQLDYLKIKLTDILVSSVKTQSLNEGLPVEEVTLNFARVIESYRPQLEDGSIGAAVVSSWNAKQAGAIPKPGASLLAAVPNQNLDQTDAFLTIAGIKGESTDSKHKDAIQIESWSWGATHSSSAAGGGGGAGKVSMQDIHFVMNSSKASALLANAVRNGQHLTNAVLTVRKAGGDSPQDYFTIKLEDVLISSYRTQGTEQTLPRDEVTLNFTKATQTYTPQDDKGGLGTPITSVFDGGLVPAVHVAGPSILAKTFADQGAQDMFLAVNGIKGESTDTAHKDQIEISSFSWGLSQTASAAGGGGGAGKASIRDFSFITDGSKASPLLMKASVGGQHLQAATFAVRKSGGKLEDYLTIKLTDVLVSSYQTGGLNDVLPTDQFSLNFANVAETIKVQQPDGTLVVGSQMNFTAGEGTTDAPGFKAPSPGTQAGAVDAFLQIEGIKGESTDSAHKETIEISSFSWGMSQTSSAAGGGGGAGKATLQDFHFVTHVGKASPLILNALGTGKHFTAASLFVRKSGGKLEDYYVIKLSDVLVSSLNHLGRNNELPLEEFSLNFTKIDYSVSSSNADGTLLPPVETIANNVGHDSSPVGQKVIGLTHSTPDTTPMFLNIAGILGGGSTDAEHKGQIEIESFSWGATNSHGSGGGGGAGKVSMQDFHFVMNANGASPVLVQRALNGKHATDATFSVAGPPGNTPFDAYVIKLSDVLVSSYSVKSSAGNLPLEEVTLNFAKVSTNSNIRRADGSVAPGPKATLTNNTTALAYRRGPNILAATQAEFGGLDYFLNVSGIKGESSDPDHKGAIEIESFSWGVTNTAANASGGGAGKVSMQDFHFSTNVSVASPLLLAAFAAESEHDAATLQVVDESDFKRMSFDLDDLMVSQIALHGSTATDVVPTDQFSLNFSKVTVDYNQPGRNR